MPAAAFLDLLDRYGAEIVERQRQATLEPAPEAFHQLRVHVKRARALLELVDTIAPKFEKKRAMRPFREPFRAAGTVRDLHVQIAIANAEAASLNIDVSSFVAMLEVRERNAIGAWLATGSRVMPEELADIREDVGRALARRRWVELASSIWFHFIARLRDVLAFDIQTSDLHELRKRVKECSNLTWIIADVAPELVVGEPLAKALDKLQKQLGDWHDLDLAIQFAAEVPTEEPGSAAPVGWNKYRASIETKCSRLRDKLLRNWNALAKLAPPGVR